MRCTAAMVPVPASIQIRASPVSRRYPLQGLSGTGYPPELPRTCKRMTGLLPEGYRIGG